mmetsp:Transcript_9178/g.13663  ORF Transcript_9178/g.13663 Transcript_9178/m.13663 type:complete len:100 (+) Transcript_9178:1175-1474(+)
MKTLLKEMIDDYDNDDDGGNIISSFFWMLLLLVLLWLFLPVWFSFLSSHNIQYGDKKNFRRIGFEKMHVNDDRAALCYIVYYCWGFDVASSCQRPVAEC